MLVRTKSRPGGSEMVAEILKTGPMPSQAREILDRLAAVVLLGGSVRPRRFNLAIQRPSFTLPIDHQFTILDLWRRQVFILSETLSKELPLRVMIDRNSPEIFIPPSSDALLASVRVERDPNDFRGTGGVLRDISLQYEPDQYILVANAAQILLRPLVSIAADLAGAQTRIALSSQTDGAPCGLMLIQRSVLNDIPEAGFVDIKEQAMPEIAKAHSVRAIEYEKPTGMPVRTLGEYVSALRRHHRGLANQPDEENPFAENLQCSFSIVESGARVDPTARIHDSVILKNGVVEAKATAVQSIICGGGVLRQSQFAVDELVSAGQPHGRGD